MKKLALLTSLILSTTVLFSQDIKVGFVDSVYSKTLDENRKIIINLPKGYDESEKSYPVFYRLDGSLNTFLESVGIINRLAYIDEVIPEMILVVIVNTDRNRDMMPTESSFVGTNPGAQNFKKFIDDELIPFIDNKYRTTKDRTLCGQSLSAIFTFYDFLTDIDSFNSFIVCSGGFLDCEDYFNDLTTNFLENKQKKTTKIFLTHGVQDFLDPEGNNIKQLNDFKTKINTKDNISCDLKIYEDEGHVPFQSLFHGLKFIYTIE